ncbi:MAG: GTP-binding protein [Bradymonadia bacterium]|jgi:GTP-binding protein
MIVTPQHDEGGVPLVAIVGRPNVGKSRLFNRLTGTRFAIVEDMPGVTRDRQYGEAVWFKRRFQVVDTGGFEPESIDELLVQMREQAHLAIDEADIIIFMVDGQSGLLPADREIAAMLRRTKKPIFTVVNKVDGDRHDMNVPEFYELGVSGEIHGISAEHGRGISDFMDDLLELVPIEKAEAEPDDELIRVAVIGKPNAGKSSLVNRLLGEERLLTSEVPGTTRDAINTYVEAGGKKYLFIDTAGVRRKRSISQRVEKYSVVHSFKAVDRADVVVYMLDATQGVTTQDQRLAGLALDKGRAMVLLLNKWDLVDKDHKTADAHIAALRDQLKFQPDAPVVTLSALTGQRAHKVLPMVDKVHAEYIRRVPTGELNRVIAEAVARNPPAVRSNSRLKIFYASQVATRPPTFMFVVNDTALIHFSYQRYLVNSLRAKYGFAGVPIKVFFRGRKNNEENER